MFDLFAHVTANEGVSGLGIFLLGVISGVVIMLGFRLAGSRIRRD